MPKKIDRRLGCQLKRVRDEAGLTQAELGGLAGVSVPTVRECERSSGTIRSLVKLISALDCTVHLRGVKGPILNGRTLVEERSLVGVSQRVVAARAGLTQPTILNLENRLSGRVESLQRLADALGVRLVLRPSPKLERERSDQKSLVPPSNQPRHDLVMTPPALAREIVRHFNPVGSVLDPCRGAGAFFDAFPATVQAEWCEISEGRDFMDWQSSVDFCISNPPFSKMRSFLTKAMDVSDNVIFLSALVHYATKARLSDIRRCGFGLKAFVMVPQPRGDWSATGFQLGAMHLQRGWGGPCEFIDKTDEWKFAVGG